MTPTFQLIYMSSLISDKPDLLPSILDSSTRNNKLRGITGMLLHADGNIIEVLEGERTVVMNTFRVIEMDKRHTGIIVLIEQEVDSRQFASWSMGFTHLVKADWERLAAALPVFYAQQDEISLRCRSGAALTLLEKFASA